MNYKKISILEGILFMRQYLENQFSQKIYLANSYIDRKIQLDDASYTIKGISKVGKTMLIKNYLLTLEIGSYLYIDCADIRLDFSELSKELEIFCYEKKIQTLVMDNYNINLQFPKIDQIIVISELFYHTDILNILEIKPLDYEEFLAYEYKFDSSALNHYFKLGGLPVLHALAVDVHQTFIQNALLASLTNVEFSILALCSKIYTGKISVYNIYEKLKKQQKISKDKLYTSFQSLVEKSYIHLIKKFQHPKAISKIYLGDISYQSSLSFQKNFTKVFENSVYITIKNRYSEVFYFDNIDFYIPSENTIIYSLAFIDERAFFKRLEQIEAFIFQYRVEKIICVTLNNEASLIHPFSQVDMIPFAIWALSE